MRKSYILVAVLSIVLFLSPGCKHHFIQTGESNDGFLRFEVDPPRAKVYVDDIYVGRAGDFSEKDLRKKEKFLRISSGKHVIRFELKGYETAKREVYVGHSVQTISLRLKRL